MEKSVANPEPAKVLARTSECMRRLMEAGLSFDALQLPIDDPKMRGRLVQFWLSGGYEATTTQRVARAIMGTNFFGIEEVTQYFGVKPTKTQLAAFAEIPFTEAELQECRDTHVLIAIFPVSIIDIRKKVERKLFYSHEDAWYNTESFAKKKGKARWYLILKEPVPNSTSKIWDEQQELLNENEETPEARVMAYTIIGHYLVTGERLFENVYVRCADFDSGGPRVGVGSFGQDGLHVDSGRDGYRYDNRLGLASSRLPAQAGKFRS